MTRALAMFSIFVAIELLNTPIVSANSMIVTWGQPTNFTAFVTYSTSSWDNCVAYCYRLTNCVLAHSPVSPVNCEIFTVGQVWEVQKLNVSSELLVAFKTSDDYNQTCPIGENAPTFGNKTVTASASTSVANYTYEISYDASDKWTFAYTAIASCPVGWTSFTRPLTTWCIKVFGGPNSLFVYTDVTSLCTQQDAVLSGVETTTERDFVANEAITLLGDDYPNFAGLWISGKRKSECATTGWESISYCTGTNIKQFSFTDTYMTNYAGYTWDPSQPDRNKYGTWPNCIQLWIRNQKAFPGFDYTEKANGNADDRQCNSNGTTGNVMRGYACGKVAEVPVGA